MKAKYLTLWFYGGLVLIGLSIIGIFMTVAGVWSFSGIFRLVVSLIMGIIFVGVGSNKNKNNQNREGGNNERT